MSIDFGSCERNIRKVANRIAVPEVAYISGGYARETFGTVPRSKLVILSCAACDCCPAGAQGAFSYCNVLQSSLPAVQLRVASRVNPYPLRRGMLASESFFDRCALFLENAMQKRTTFDKYGTICSIQGLKNGTIMVPQWYHIYTNGSTTGMRHKVPVFGDSLEIVYRKGTQNEADALSRRPDLKYYLNQYDENTFEQDLESTLEFLGGMYHLQDNASILTQVREGYKTDPYYCKNTVPPGLRYDRERNLYWMADKLAIPKMRELRHQIWDEYHTTAGHPSMERTLSSILKAFWWPGMRKEAKTLWKTCPVCPKIKGLTSKPPGSLLPLPVPNKPWEYCSVDYITHLPAVDGYDSICTFVDCFSKQAHFIPCSTKIDARQMSKLYLKEIFRHHGLSRVIISDRDTKFTSKFWQTLMKDLKTKLNMSSSYHPQTDGSTERAHRTIEQILRGYVYNQQLNWVNDLPLAEFHYNYTQHSTTGYSPFETLYGMNPLVPITIIIPPEGEEVKPHEHVQKIRDTHALIEEQIKIAKAFQKYYADARTKEVHFQVGDRVLISTEHLNIRGQLTPKFKQRYIGPYYITDMISTQAVKVELPPAIEVHPVFHISKLKHWDPTAGDHVDVLPTRADTVHGRIVERISDAKVARHAKYERGTTLVLKVHWQDPRLKDSWECWSDLKQLDKTYIRQI